MVGWLAHRCLCYTCVSMVHSLLGTAVTLHVAAALVPRVGGCIQGAALLLDQIPLSALQAGGDLEPSAAGN